MLDVPFYYCVYTYQRLTYTSHSIRAFDPFEISKLVFKRQLNGLLLLTLLFFCCLFSVHQILIASFCLPIEKRCLLAFRCALNRHCFITSVRRDSFRLFTHFAVDQYLPLIRIKHTEFADRWILHGKNLCYGQSRDVIYLFTSCFFTSIVKSQSGDGVRRFVFASWTDGEELGSSGITANRPRWHGDVGPYVPVRIKVWKAFFFILFSMFSWLYSWKIICHPLNAKRLCVCS